MNIEAFKKLRKKVESRGRGNADLIYLKDDETHNIRLVPNKYNEDEQFIMVYLLYRGGGIVTETTYSPRTWGDQCPVEDLVSQQLTNRVGKEKFKHLMNMNPSLSVLTTAVVRGKEEEGVKWLALSEAQFKELSTRIQNAYETDEDFSLTDPTNAYDIIVEVQAGDRKAGKPRKFIFDIQRKSSLLVKDENLLEKLLEEQPDYKTLYPAPSREELLERIKTAYELGNMAHDSADDELDQEYESASEDEDDMDASDYSAPTVDEDDDEDEDIAEAMKKKMQALKAKKEKAKKDGSSPF